MIDLKIHFIPQFKKQANMIAALPDMGNVSGIGINFLSEKLHAKLFAEIYSYWPPYALYDNGIISHIQTSYKFYFVEKYDLIIFTGDFNPSDPIRLYEIVNEVLRMGERFNINTIFSIGGIFKQNSINSNLIYFATTNSKFFDICKKYGAILLEGQGQILGFNGLVIGLAKEKGINGLCILGEINNPNIIQPKIAQNILNVLIKILNMDTIDMKELDEEEKRKNFMQQQLGYFEKVIEQNKPPGIA